ncbi:MAG: sulfite exporter TauE/SafE family protein [Xanthobacteraceae bacterium]
MLDVLYYAAFLIATFAASTISSLAGFAFAPIIAAIWLHILSPIESVSLIAAFGMIVQGIGVWHFRRALEWRRLAPFLLGAAAGIPPGLVILQWADVRLVKAAVGVVLILFSAYSVLRPSLAPVRFGGRFVDAAIGFANGVLAGVAGIPGIFVVMWATLRRWPNDVQRAVFQPLALSSFVIIALLLGGSGAITAHMIKLFFLGLPVLLAGTWLGLRLYGRLDPQRFRLIVLVLLAVSGGLLVIPPSQP